jgi:hypothetical protein
MRRDVYEFELPGEGSCTSGNPNFDPAAGGCHFLMSSGKSGDDSYFVDASTTGRDAFIATRQQFVGWDVNQNFDVYDLREGGGFPEPPPVPPVCSGETCKPSTVAQPPVPSLSTPTFSGPGNSKPSKPKHKNHQKKKHKKNHGKKRKGLSHRTGGGR